jgi:hypothetical protein
MMKLVNRFLPGMSDEEGDKLRAGSEVRRSIPDWLTRSADKATTRNNETRS